MLYDQLLVTDSRVKLLIYSFKCAPSLSFAHNHWDKHSLTIILATPWKHNGKSMVVVTVLTATVESEKPCSKRAVVGHLQTTRTCVNLCIFVSRIYFQDLSGFKLILINHVGTNLLEERPLVDSH